MFFVQARAFALWMPDSVSVTTVRHEHSPIRAWMHHLGVLVGGWVSCSVWNWDSCSGLAGSFEDVGWCVRGFRPPDGSYVSEPHVCVVVADRCSWQLFVAVGGTPSSASVNLPPLFCEACLFILCAFTVVVIVTADRSYIPKWSSTPKKCLKVITM